MSGLMNNFGEIGKKRPPYSAFCLNNYRKDCFDIQ
jgi:hypothetical protein